MPGEKGLVAGRSLGVHDVPGGAAREGPAYLLELLDAEASFGRRCEFEVICLLIRTRAGWQRSSSNRDVAGPRGCSTREGRQSGGRSLVGASRCASWAGRWSPYS
jgi:hypothetical protein